MSDYQEMVTALQDAPNLLVGVGVKEFAVRSAEKEVGTLTSDYERFLREYGWAVFGSTAIWGLGDGFPYDESFVKMTIDEREKFGLPGDLIAFSNNGAGDILCFRSFAGASDQRIYVHLHETRTVELQAESFSRYIIDRVSIEANLLRPE